MDGGSHYARPFAWWLPGPPRACSMASVSSSDYFKSISDYLECLSHPGSVHARPRRQIGLRLERKARIPSRASGSWLVAAMTSMA